MVTSLLDQSKVIIRPMKDGNGERTFKLGPIVTMSCHQWDSNAKQTPRQPTTGPSATRWLEELFHEPSQTKEPSIPGPSPSSKPPEDVPICEPELEVALAQSMEEPFVQSPSHSHYDAHQEFTDLQLTLMIPRAIVHKLINQILLEHCCLLHMIPFVDAPGIPGGTKLPPWQGTGGLSKGGHHRDSLQILRRI
ncbi:hypothetical protein O181_055403 [Austropuccinia psidii MF-1]|uniref:Uncharacterized protein n=1 Tax=Austropuccinia psidii MF-1 TaxID=1389203 RepID=A0A9Q3E7T3_9BASI|nr:hypothetical protein [Austropuccinia psidii MF-1]